MYFPKGSSIVFDTPESALGFFCGQRLRDVPMDGRRMGLHELDLDKRWLMIDGTYERQMRQKPALLDDHPEDIVVTEEDATPEEAAKTHAAKKETLRLVVAHLLKHNPEIFERRENGVVRNKLLG